MGGGGGCRVPSLCPATASLMASASFNGFSNRYFGPVGRLPTEWTRPAQPLGDAGKGGHGCVLGRRTYRGHDADRNTGSDISVSDSTRGIKDLQRTT